MKHGKIPESILKRSVLKPITYRRPEVLVGAGIGLDGAVIKIEADEVIVLSTDPITFSYNNMTLFAIHKSISNLVVTGARPIGIMLTIMAPDILFESELKEMMVQFNKICKEMEIQIIGGHTEVTDAVNRPILSLTAVGAVKEVSLLSVKKIKTGQDIVMTKAIGLEGTAIIAFEKEPLLKERFSSSYIHQAKSFLKDLSIVNEAAVAIKHGVTAMHDISGGGIFGALWEMAASADVGLEVRLKDIAVRQETIEFCEIFDINPYQMRSGGSVLMIIDNGNDLVVQLNKEGINATVIGKITDGNDRVVLNDEDRRFIDPPRHDEILKIFKGDVFE